MTFMMVHAHLDGVACACVLRLVVFDALTRRWGILMPEVAGG